MPHGADVYPRLEGRLAVRSIIVDALERDRLDQWIEGTQEPDERERMWPSDSVLPLWGA